MIAIYDVSPVNTVEWSWMQKKMAAFLTFHAICKFWAEEYEMFNGTLTKPPQHKLKELDPF